MKKILTFLAVLLVAVSASAESYILYTTTNGEAINPWSIDGFGANFLSNSYDEGQGKLLFDGEITAIGNRAFEYCETLETIEIPTSVTSIGYQAFLGCKKLKSIVIPDKVVSIGNSAFSKCEELSSLLLGKSVTTIGAGAFNECNMESVIIPDNVTEIVANTFRLCQNLKYVSLSDKIVSIGFEAFHGCSFTSIDLPNTLTTIDARAFASTDITSINIPNSVTSIGRSAFESCGSLISATLPNSITNLEECLFNGCRKLGPIVIPNSVTKIGYECFGSCYNIGTLVIPNSVTSIGNRCFYYCHFSKLVFEGEVETVGSNLMDERTSPYYSIRIPASDNDDFKNKLIAGNMPEGKIFKGVYPLSDSDPYTLDEDVNDAWVTYTRTFTGAYNQPLFLPFSLSEEEWSAVGDVYEFTNADVSTAMLYWTKLSGPTVAGKPYLLVPKIPEGETSVTLHVSAQKALKSRNTINEVEHNGFVLSGTYSSKNIAGERIYALSKGTFKYTKNASKPLPPYRIYLKVPDSITMSAPLKMSFGDGEGTTFIQEVDFDIDSDVNQKQVNLFGQPVGKDYKGIVIENGKKVIRK